MELKEFIAQTIQEVVNGVVEARDTLPDSFRDLSVHSDAVYGTRVKEISFHLEVAVNESKEGKGGISVVIPLLNANGKTVRSSEESTRNSISFNVPIALPIVCGRRES